MRTTIAAGGLALAGLAALMVPARGDEEKIALDKVPKAVMSAFKAKFPKAEIKAAIKEEEDGETVFEIESTLDGKSIDAVLEADGEFVEIEREIAAEDLPAPVVKALAARYPEAKIEKIEAVTKGKKGKTTYEVAIKAEIVFNAKGKAPKAKAAEDDDEKKPAAKASKSKEKDDKDDDEDEDDDEMREKAKTTKPKGKD